MGTTKQRIGYIDAMRGVTILLVVYSHLYVLGIKTSPESWLQETFRLFRMPLFFFISGFIAYTAVERFSNLEYGKRLLKKAKVQLIPTVVFVTLFLLAKGLDFNHLFLSGGALAGYWFTVALFWMFVAYYTVSWLSNKINPRLFIPLLAIVAVTGFELFADTKIYVDNDAAALLCLKHSSHYMMFFVIGILFRKYMDVMSSWLRNNYVRAGLLAAFVVCAYVVRHTPKADPWHFYLENIVGPIAGLLTVVAIFQRHATYFESDNKLCRALRFLGKRTLDIYLLHYFMLPDLGILKFLFRPDNCAFEFPIALIAVLIITGMCLLASAVIRNSDFLAHWLFGAKKSVKGVPQHSAADNIESNAFDNGGRTIEISNAPHISASSRPDTAEESERKLEKRIDSIG